MQNLGMPNIEVGFAQASGDDAFQTGVDVASIALEGIKWHQVSAGLVLASSSHNLSELMRGIRSVVDEAPVFGSAISDESLKGEVAMILLASPFLDVKISIGRNVSKSWKKAVRQATRVKDLKRYFTAGSDIWFELARSGKSVFSIIFTPGRSSESESSSFNILEILKRRSDGRLPFVGGAVTGNGDTNSNYLLLNDEVIQDGLMIAIFETGLKTGIGMAHGFSPSKTSMTATKVKGNVVLELDKKSAAAVYSEIVGTTVDDLKDKHLDLTTGITLGISDIYGHHSLRIAQRITEGNGIEFSEPVPLNSSLSVMESKTSNLIQAEEEAFKGAILRGNITEPELCISFSNIFRNKLLGEKVDAEIPLLEKMGQSIPLLKFPSFGEHGVSFDGLVKHNQKSISLVVFGQGLSDAAEVAIENKHLVGQLLLADASQKTLLNLMPDSVMATDKDFKITHWNPAAEILTGFPMEKVIGLGIDKVLHPHIIWLLKNAAQTMAAEDIKSKSFEAELVRIDSTLVSVEVTVAHNPHQEQYALVCVFHDMTGYKKSEDRLRRERQAYRAIAEAAINAPTIESLCKHTLVGLIETLDFDVGRIRLIDEEKQTLVLAAAVGTSESEIPLEIKIQTYEKGAHLGAETAVTREPIFAPDIGKSTKLKGKTKNLEKKGIQGLILYPIQSSNGLLMGILNLDAFTPKDPSDESRIFFEVIANMFATILERRFAQGALVDSEEKMRMILKSMRDIVFVLDENDHYSEFYCSDEELQYGKLEDIINHHVADVLPAIVAERFIRTAKQVRKTGLPETFDYSLDIDDRNIWFSASFALHEDRTNIIAISRDITQRKVTENILAKRLEYEKALANVSQTLLVSQDDSIQVLREVLLNLLRASNSSRIYIFENYSDAKKGLAIRLVAARTAEGLQNSEEVLAGNATPYADGFARWQRDPAKGKHISGIVEKFPLSERKLLQSLGVISMLVLPLWVQGKWFGFIAFDDVLQKRKWTTDEVRLLRTASEMISGYIGRMNAETDLRTSFRDLELYSSILNHDFANDIMVILNQIEVAEMMGLNEERLMDIKDTSKASAERMTQALTIFRAQEGKTEQNIVLLLKQITTEAKTAYPDLEINLETKPTVLNLRISAGRLLSMVFLNLLRNSSEYGGDATKVNITITRSDKDIVITFSDNGPGIDKSIASKLFQRGASTTGGGLGLYLSRKVIESYEGSIKLITGKKSQKQGAMFEIRLPLA